MALSNRFGWMVLTTGNKSELAVGYATLYGDMAGGFSVIKDVPKLLVYELCHDLNRRKGREIVPANVLEKPPSAELRPTRSTPTRCRRTRLDPVLEAYIDRDHTRADLEGLGFDPELVRRVARSRRPGRVQAAPEPAGPPHHGQGVRQGAGGCRSPTPTGVEPPSGACEPDNGRSSSGAATAGCHVSGVSVRESGGRWPIRRSHGRRSRLGPAGRSRGRSPSRSRPSGSGTCKSASDPPLRGARGLGGHRARGST
ncbi:MAG: NAD(+) synthase [Acidimicrobiia bacterium]|nr:NAD(+) synthase [Acidimicrobiia bacterium]